MSDYHPRSKADNSGLLHLMEAATALTQLVDASTTAGGSSRSATPSVETKALLNPISDDDSTMASSHMSMLRKNHLKALHAASLLPQESANSGVKMSAVETPAPATANAAAPNSKDKEIFPMKLHELLADSSVRDVVSWLPHGNSFVILRPEIFATTVLPRYFAPEGSSKGGAVHKYPSFTRRLNRWGFRQVSRGADAGAFCHELFRRDEPEACRGMVCQKSRKTVRDDCKSVSSTSTVSTHSGEKRSLSATVTVSTVGASFRSLPPKKRRGIVSSDESGIPANVEMKPNNSSLLAKKVTVGSNVETVSNLSADGPVKSINISAAPRAVSLDNSSAAAKEALARHFYEQHRAFALASLMENSRKAMLSRGMDVESSPSTKPIVEQPRREDLGATTNSQVFAPTVAIHQTSNQTPDISPSQHSAAAETAKNALYEAYKKALARS